MKKRRFIQYLYFWLYTIFALIVPLCLIIDRYGFVDKETPSGYKWSAGLIISIFIAIFYFRKHLARAIDNMCPCLVKYIFTGIKELAPLIAVYIIFLFINLQMDNLVFIMQWSCVSNALALVFRTLHLRQIDYNIKTDKIEEQNENNNSNNNSNNDNNNTSDNEN